MDADAPHPLVSVIIPTFGRPDAVETAVRSVLCQTMGDLELIVVVDGHDPETCDRLAGIADTRLRVVVHEGNRGPAIARNSGVLAARGHWIALLDDDDAWLPTKLDVQFDMVRRFHPDAGLKSLGESGRILVSCRVVALVGDRRYTWPTRAPRTGEDVSDYLLDRLSILGRPGLIGTSSVLASRQLFRIALFQADEDHEDWSWFLTCLNEHGAELIFAWEPLCTYTIAPHQESRSRRQNWLQSYAWAFKYRHLVTPNAFAAFLSTKVAMKARAQHDFAGLLRIGWAAVRLGRPRLRHVLTFLGVAVLPLRLSRGARRRSLSG